MRKFGCDVIAVSVCKNLDLPSFQGIFEEPEEVQLSPAEWEALHGTVGQKAMIEKLGILSI